MKVDTSFWIITLTTVAVIATLVLSAVYWLRGQKQHLNHCFDAMLRMLLQPTPTNISALDKLLQHRFLSQKRRHQLLYQAEMEADCLSIMPTGELRSSQPFLQQRYQQILTTADSAQAVKELIKTRLSHL